MVRMPIVSCRGDFWSATAFAPADEIRHLDLTSGQGPRMGTAEFLASVADQRIAILVHGYNSDQHDVLAAYRTIAERMRLFGFIGGSDPFYEGLVGFAWPGGASGLSFPIARRRATRAAARFNLLLRDLATHHVAVDLNTHSLGAHVAFEALRIPGTRVRAAWNFASAVDDESIELGERYHAATQQCERMYVFHSARDLVLRWWYRAGDVIDFDTALGCSGPEDPRVIMDHSPNVRVVNCKDVVDSHGGYRESGHVWSFISRELIQPTADQFTRLQSSAQAVEAVFESSGGRGRQRRRRMGPRSR